MRLADIHDHRMNAPVTRVRRPAVLSVEDRVKPPERRDADFMVTGAGKQALGLWPRFDALGSDRVQTTYPASCRVMTAR
jgi:hypothetical protein